MRIEINNKEQNTEIKFPCLMISEKNNLYLIDGYSDCGKYYKGMALKHLDGINYYTFWDKKILKTFNGSITLSN
jgi:hypothetical protein